MSASEVDKSPIVERLARMAGLREFEALEFRRKNGESMTEPELHAWRRIEHFACLVPTAIATCAPETNTSNSTPGTGPVAAS